MREEGGTLNSFLQLVSLILTSAPSQLKIPTYSMCGSEMASGSEMEGENSVAMVKVPPTQADNIIHLCFDFLKLFCCLSTSIYGHVMDLCRLCWLNVTMFPGLAKQG